MLPHSVRYPFEILLLTAVYLAVALIGLAFAIPPGNATAVWPASGVALAAVMLRGNRVAGDLGALLANGTTTVSLTTAAAIASGNTVEALLAAWLCRRWISRVRRRFNRSRRRSVSRPPSAWPRRSSRSFARIRASRTTSPPLS
jgi:integral membrane sensor domain MASE1